MIPELWNLDSPPSTDNDSPTASPPVVASPPPVASPAAADISMDGAFSFDFKSNTVIFNPGVEKRHEAVLRLAVTGLVV